MHGDFAADRHCVEALHREFERRIDDTDGEERESGRSLRVFIAETRREGNKRDLAWVIHLLEYEAFVREHGRPPRHRSETILAGDREARLFRWAKRQREYFRHELLCDYQIRRLRCAPMFVFRSQRTFDERLDEFVGWVKQFGRRPRSRSSSRAERELYRWLAGRRRAFRNGRLTPEQVQALDERLGAWWRPRAD